MSVEEAGEFFDEFSKFLKTNYSSMNDIYSILRMHINDLLSKNDKKELFIMSYLFVL